MKAHPEIKTKYIIALYKKGFSLPAISEVVGMTNQAIWDRLKKAKVKRRSMSESVKLSYENGRSKKYFGEKNHLWKGGRYKDIDGYINIQVNGKQVFEHRFIWEKHYGRLPRGWLVHHLNGVRDDNRIENLQAMPRKKHNPRLQFEPYEKRILELERRLKELEIPYTPKA